MAICAGKDCVYVLLEFLKIPSTLLYVVVLITFVKYRKDFMEPFFIISFSLGLADIGNAVMHSVIALFTWQKQWQTFALANYDHWLPSLIASIWDTVFMSQLFGVFIMTVNRFTAIVRRDNHQALWTNKLLATFLVCQWAIPAVYCLGLYNLHPGFQASFSNYSLYWQFSEDWASVVIDSGFLLVTAVLIVVLTILYGWMTVELCRHGRRLKRSMMESRNRRQDPEDRRRSGGTLRADAKLAGIGLVLTICVAICCAYYGVHLLKDRVIVHPAMAVLSAWSNSIYVFSDFVFTFSNPYLLLLLSTLVRHRFLTLVRWRK